MNDLLQALQNPNAAAWTGLATTALRIVLILLAAWIAAAVFRRVIRLFRERVAQRIDDVEAVKRAATLARVFRHLVTVVISLIAGMLILTELGVSVAPILGAAGVVGLAIGFGAQSLVKDYFSGFFILLENQVRQGDVVQIADKSGLVEEVTLRYIRLRDYEGGVHFVPTGLVTTVTNLSRDFAFAVIDIGIAYRARIGQAFDVMRAVAQELRADAAIGPKILDDLEIAGVERLADSAVVLRARFKVVPLEQWNVRREFLRRLKEAFDAHGIEIPFPHLTVYPGLGKEGGAPEFRIRSRADASASSSAA
jgi:small conductance mechanosensitive channel